MENSSITKLNLILDQIENKLTENKTLMVEKLNLEVEKAYAYNALGVCKSKLNNGRGDDFREGINRTKVFFEKIKKINY